MIKSVVFLLVLFVHSTAFAEDTVPLMKDEVAPFSGLLVPEDRFKELLRAEAQADKSAAELLLERRLREKVTEIYSDSLAKATQPPKFYQTPQFNRWVGFGLGVAFTSACLYGGAQAVKASN